MSAGNQEMFVYSKYIAESRLAKHLADSGMHQNVEQQFGDNDTKWHTDVIAYDNIMKCELHHDLKVVKSKNKSSGNYSISKSFIQFVDPGNPLLKKDPENTLSKEYVSKKKFGEKPFPECYIKRHYTTFELYDKNGSVKDEYASVNSVELMKILPSVLADIENPNNEDYVVVSLDKIKSLCHVRVI